MKKRLMRIAVVVLAVLVVGFLVIVYGPQRRDAITQANFQKIKKGMPTAEVTTLLGTPTERNPFAQAMKYHVWHGERGTIKITYDSDGLVDSGYFTPSQSMLNQMRDWFGQ